MDDKLEKRAAQVVTKFDVLDYHTARSQRSIVLFRLMLNIGVVIGGVIMYLDEALTLTMFLTFLASLDPLQGYVIDTVDCMRCMQVGRSARATLERDTCRALS